MGFMNRVMPEALSQSNLASAQARLNAGSHLRTLKDPSTGEETHLCTGEKIPPKTDAPVLAFTKMDTIMSVDDRGMASNAHRDRSESFKSVHELPHPIVEDLVDGGELEDRASLTSLQSLPDDHLSSPGRSPHDLSDRLIIGPGQIAASSREDGSFGAAAPQQGLNLRLKF
jgi:hypothetical protein